MNTLRRFLVLATIASCATPDEPAFVLPAPMVVDAVGSYRYASTDSVAVLGVRRPRDRRDIALLADSTYTSAVSIWNASGTTELQSGGSGVFQVHGDSLKMVSLPAGTIQLAGLGSVPLSATRKRATTITFTTSVLVWTRLP